MILEHYSLLSKQPNYICGLFFYDLVFMLVSWPEQSWAFPKRLGLFQQGLIIIYYYFQKLIESPTTVRQKEERDIPGPWDNLEGKSCLAGSFLVPWPCHGLGASRRLPTVNIIKDIKSYILHRKRRQVGKYMAMSIIGYIWMAITHFMFSL